MKGARGWAVIIVIALAIAGIAYLVQPHKGSPEHSSNSDAADGTSAARLLAAAMGHPTDQVAGTFALPAAGSLLFVFSPTSAYTSADAEDVMRWLRSGGVLIYATEQGDPELDSALGLRREGDFVDSSSATANPVLAGVDQVAGGGVAESIFPMPNQVPVLRSGGRTIGLIERVGAGTAVVLTDPLMLCNGYLSQADNGRFLADLLGLVDAQAPVAFDEYHHGLILSDFAPQAWISTPWGAALLWLVVAIFASLVLRGRAFGPILPRPPDVARADAEWAVAVGELLRRSGGRSATLGMLARASERAVATRTGLPLEPRERFWSALYVRAPEVANELAQAEQELRAATAGDAQLIVAAQRLHRIAFPAPTRTSKESR
jgi:hypothetical protein